MSGYSGHGPRCPNHQCVLTKTKDKGIGICPVSGYRFTYKADEAEAKKKHVIKNGKITKETDWDVTSIDGDGG